MISYFCLLGALIFYHVSCGQGNLIPKIREDIRVSMSGRWKDMYASRAVDGNENTIANSCNCCSATNGSQSWWRLNLGKQYLIKTIIFIGRTDSGAGSQSRGFSIYKRFSNSTGQELLDRNTNTTGHRFTIHLNPPVALQHLEVNKSGVLTICELKLEEDECSSGHFGYPCQQCGNCKNNGICDPTTGMCHYGCQPGYTGTLCKQQCANGRFGQNCESLCHCLNNATCNHINGSCPENLCAHGWKNFDCNTVCDGGTFGVNCKYECHCRGQVPCEKVDGVCDSGQCANGWKGSSCSTKCPDGRFGQDCGSICHCQNNVSCNHTNGRCPNDLCAPGWREFDCNTECNDGTFGLKCQNECHCRDQVPCEKEDGKCSYGRCADGWKGSSCNTKCDSGTFGQNCELACHCLNNAVCNYVNGRCPADICAPGWKALDCNTECENGTFGLECQNDCHCQDNVACEKVNGRCPSDLCANGWKESNCSTKCSARTFGQNCSFVCHCQNNETCNRVNGSCPNSVFCAPGWKDADCNTECDDGTFGQNCESECHCRNPEICDKISGSCLSGLCSTGWRGAQCDTRCLDGSFGQNCSSICHCLDNVTCSHISGKCPDDSCAPGWRGGDCNTVVEAIKTSAEGPSTGAIVGAVVGVLVLSSIVLIAAIVYRKRNSPPKSKLNQERLSELEENKESDKTTSKKLLQSRQQRKQTNDKDEVDVGTDHTYYAFGDSQAKRIPVHEIWDYIRLAHNNKCEKLHQEFQKLPSGLVYDCNEARRPENAKKTRYKQMFAYDHSRVVLKRDDPNDSTYINASYIDGYRKTRKFIASQGPMDAMVGDFWEMVIQENTSIIIMLTNVVEHAVIKCIQYWPTSENEKLTFGNVTVLTSKIDTHPDYTIRELDISKEGVPPKRITQYHFTAWPDKDVPDAAWHLVNFWRRVNSVVQTIKEPVVVHCSAGIGRTGTFIGIDNLHAQAMAEGYIQPFDMITRMRHQRVNMVQTKFQYVFLHEAVAEALYIGVKPVKANEFDAVYKLLLEPDNTTGVTGQEQQHKLIKDNPIITDEASEYCNVTPSKEYDAYRPKGMAASSSGNDNDLDMCYFHNYDGKDTFIVTRTSNEHTVETLWKTIEKRNIKTVITLFDDNDRAEMVLDKRNQEHRENGHSKSAVQLIKTTSEKHFIEKTFTAMPNKSGKESWNIKQFMFLAMKDKPTDAASVISFLNAIQRWQPSVEESQPILITHENAFERCGLMYLLLCEFDRTRTKEEVDILATVRHLKDKNPRLIPNYEQYKLCYSAVLEYIRQSDVYMNV